MRIQFFDVDEVILKFTESFLKFANSELKTDYDVKNTYTYDIGRSFNIPNRKFLPLFHEFIFSNRIGDLEYYEDAVEYFAKTPHVVKILLTALPRTKMTTLERKRNLHRLKFDKLLFSEHKENYVKYFKPELIFEDKPENVLKYLSKRKHFGKICVPRRPFNKELEKELSKDNQVVFYDSMTELL